MATLYTNRPTENESEATLLDYLRDQLPEDYVVIGNVSPIDSNRVPEIDAVVVKETAVFTIETKHWYGPITGNPAAGRVTVGYNKKERRNPLHQADKQAKQLASYLRQTDQAEAVFGDARIATSLYVIPLVIFTNPGADVQLEQTARVGVLTLEDAPAAITDPQLCGRKCTIEPHERHQIAKLLLNELPATPQPKLEEVIETLVETPAETREIPKEVMPLPSAEPQKKIAEDVTSPAIMVGAEDDSLTSLPERPRIIHESVPEDLDFTAPVDVEEPKAKASRFSLLTGVMGWMTDLPARAEEGAEKVEERLVGQKQGRISDARLARAIERQMEKTLNHLLHGIVAHNHYVVGLSSYDFEQLLPLQDRVEAGLAQHLQEIAEARDYEMVEGVAIELVEMSGLKPGACEVRSFIRKTAVTKTGRPYLELAGSGKRFLLSKPINGIGRRRENEIYTGDMDRQKITSRQHAEIRREEEGYLLYDRGSSRGTYLNGHRLNGAGIVLNDGDCFILGPTQRVDKKRPLQGSLMFVFRQG